VRNLKKGLTRDQHFAPGAILKLEVERSIPIGYGVAGDTYGFYINSPFFQLTEGFASQRTSVVARYPNTDVIASGWLKGEELMAGRAAVVSIDMNPAASCCSACARSTARRRTRRSRCSSTRSISRRPAMERPRLRTRRLTRIAETQDQPRVSVFCVPVVAVTSVLSVSSVVVLGARRTKSTTLLQQYVRIDTSNPPATRARRRTSWPACCSAKGLPSPATNGAGQGDRAGAVESDVSPPAGKAVPAAPTTWTWCRRIDRSGRRIRSAGRFKGPISGAAARST
jgi:hypothetical protein